MSVTLDCRTALAAAITTAGVTCRPYDDWDIDNMPCATLGSPEWELSDGQDQGFGVRAVTLPVYVYQDVDADIESSLAFQDANFHTVLHAIGVDRTLGGAVRDVDVLPMAKGELMRVESTGFTYSVVTVRVTLTPHPNVG